MGKVHRLRVRVVRPRARGSWRRWYCRGCGAPVRYGRTYCPVCEDEIYIDEAILAPQVAETLCARRMAGEPRLRDARRGRLAGEE